MGVAGYAALLWTALYLGIRYAAFKVAGRSRQATASRDATVPRRRVVDRADTIAVAANRGVPRFVRMAVMAVVASAALTVLWRGRRSVD